MVSVNGEPPIAARALTGVGGPALVSAAKEGAEALVVFDQGDVTKPIIVGLVDATADQSGAGPKRREVVIDGEHLVIEGRRSVTLKCGKGSIEIREDGKVFVRGTHLVSRATGVNRIRGGAVRIN